MPPIKPGELLLDEFIQADISAWIEAKQRDLEQLEFEKSECFLGGL